MQAYVYICLSILQNKIQEHSTFSISTTECPMLDDPANGTVTWTSLTTGSVATYECDPGFELVGEMNRICQTNSQWSGAPPICRRMCTNVCLFFRTKFRNTSLFPSLIISTTECPMLDNPANGMVTWTSLTTGGVATYECDPGFELVGEMNRICQSNSQWSGAPPICRRRFILSHCVHMCLSHCVHMCLSHCSCTCQTLRNVV